MPTMVEQKKREYELTEPEYIAHRVESEVRNYDRAIEHEKQYLDQVSDKRPREKEKLQWKIKMWENQLARLKSGEWQRVNTSYLHEHYAKMLKKAISTGQPVPQPIIDQAPEYKAAQTSRERYEKGWKTSFANRSVAINEQMREHLGYKVKRQDGTPITSAQLEEIATGVGDVESVLGPLHDLFDKTDITIVHTSGKHPFLSGFGGTYTSHEKAVNIGVAGVKALGHELGHWLDFESGKAEHLTSRVYSKTGKSQESTSATESWEGRYKDQKTTALGQLIDTARYNINKMSEVRQYMKADFGKDKTAEEKEQIKLVREQLSPYWREPREIWARLVEQYIATRNGRAGLATDSPEHYEHRPGWWTKEDFARMMPQVEVLVKARLKALRGSDVVPARKGATAEVKLEQLAGEVKLLEGPKATPPVVVDELKKPQPVVPAKPLTLTKAQLKGITARLRDKDYRGKDLGDAIQKVNQAYESGELDALDRVGDEYGIDTDQLKDALEEKAKAPYMEAHKEQIKAGKFILTGAKARTRESAELIANTQEGRPTRALLLDLAIQAKRVVPMTAVVVWGKNPNRMDIRGIDTPGSQKVSPGVGYADKGKGRLSRTHRKGFSRVKFT